MCRELCGAATSLAHGVCREHVILAIGRTGNCCRRQGPLGGKASWQTFTFGDIGKRLHVLAPLRTSSCFAFWLSCRART